MFFFFFSVEINLNNTRPLKIVCDADDVAKEAEELWEAFWVKFDDKALHPAGFAKHIGQEARLKSPKSK